MVEGDRFECIQCVLGTLQPSNRLKVLMIEDDDRETPLHKAARMQASMSVKAMLDQLPAIDQLQLLSILSYGKTAEDVSQGATRNILQKYHYHAQFQTLSGESYF